MGILRCRQVVCAGFRDIRAVHCCIESLLPGIIHLDRNLRRTTRLQQIRLGKSDQYNGRHLNAVLPVKIGIWLLQIDLDNFLAGNTSGVGHIQTDLIAAFDKFDLQVVQRKTRVRQSVSKGKCDHVVIPEVLSGERVLISCLIIPVPHIQSFRISQVPVSMIRFAVCDLKVADVHCGRCTQAVVHPGIR